jgi:zinc transporter ZupT
MDTTLMTNVITSGTTMLSSLVGVLFTFIYAILPILLGFAAVGLIVWGIKWIMGHMHSVHKGGKS